MIISQSPNWKKFNKLIKQNPGKTLDGFPFREKFPTLYAGRRYKIILVSGIYLEAEVDDSQEFMSDGLAWKTVDGNKEKGVVAAWKLLT